LIVVSFYTNISLNLGRSMHVQQQSPMGLFW